MNKFLSANKSKIVWIVIGIIAMAFIVIVIQVYQYATQPVFFTLEPPSAILQVQGAEQESRTCAYYNGENFWSVASTPNKALVTGSPFSATLKFTADKPPLAISLQALEAAKLGTPTETSYRNESYFVWRGGCFGHNANATLTKELDLKTEQTFTVELKSGLYLINVFVKWAEHITGIYVFLVEVK